MSERIMILKELKERLDGKCSYDICACPVVIEDHLFSTKTIWNCGDCVDNFFWLVPVIEDVFVCPCGVVKDYNLLELRIDEMIEEEEGLHD